MSDWEARYHEERRRAEAAEARVWEIAHALNIAYVTTTYDEIAPAIRAIQKRIRALEEKLYGIERRRI